MELAIRSSFCAALLTTGLAAHGDGVALAAIQGLNARLEEKDAEIDELRAELGALRAQVAALVGRGEPTEPR